MFREAAALLVGRTPCGVRIHTTMYELKMTLPGRITKMGSATSIWAFSGCECGANDRTQYLVMLSPHLPDIRSCTVG